MSAPYPPTGGATDAEIAAALAALLAVRTSTDPDGAAPDGDRIAAPGWRRATGPLPGGWSVRGWRSPARPRSWS